MPSLLEQVIYDLIILLMKTYSKLLNCFASLIVPAFVFSSVNVSAANERVVIPSIEKENSMNIELTPPSNLQIISIVPFEYNGGVHIRCYGTSTGKATVQVQGGVAPYTYQWSGLPNQTDATAVGMQAGTYIITVTDAVGNTVSGSVTLIENPPLQVITNIDPILCHGGVATVTLSATGGTPFYSGLNWYQVTAGTHAFIVADANGCRKKAIVEITEPPELVATSTASTILCSGGTAEVVVDATGGVGPYNGTGLYNEQAGTPLYVITDANGCYAYTDVVIDEPQPLSTSISHTDVLCRGGDAEITVDGIGGVPPYLGTGVFMEMAGSYQYTITDANGCQSSSSVSISQPPALVATISNTPILCNGDISAVEVLATGGTAPYFGTGNYYVNAGLHSYTVTDDNGCSVEIATMITEPSEIEVFTTLTPSQDGEGLSIVDVTAVGGTPTYSGTGTFQETPGTYVYTVYDVNGCAGNGIVTIPNYAPSSMGTVPVSENAGGRPKSQMSSAVVQASYNTALQKSEITFELDYDSDIRVDIYDAAGSLVQRIHQDVAWKGQKYKLLIDSEGLRNGVYVCHFQTSKEEIVEKLQIIK